MGLGRRNEFPQPVVGLQLVHVVDAVTANEVEQHQRGNELRVRPALARGAQADMPPDALAQTHGGSKIEPGQGAPERRHAPPVGLHLVLERKNALRYHLVTPLVKLLC